MAAKSVTLGGQKFVILPEAEYQTLRKRAGKRAVSKPAEEDAEDVRVATERLNDPRDKAIPYAVLRKTLGL